MHIIQKRAVHIRLKTDYRSHTRPMFYQLKTLTVQDMVDFNSINKLMYKVYNNLLPANIMLYFQKVNTSHYHNIHMRNCNFK